MRKEILALSAVRSAIGAFGGSLATFSPEDLGAIVAREAFVRAGIDGAQASYAVVGNVIPCGVNFPYVPRLLTVNAGMAMESTVMACNRLCGSAMQAIVSVAQAIEAGDAEIGLAGGVEVMSAGGYLSPAMRSGARMGDTKLVDMMVAALTDPFGAGHMGMTAENQATKWGLSREEQDAFALVSQQRAAHAIADGRFVSQIVPVTLKTRKGEVVFATDEHPRATTLEALAKMKPAFKKEGGTVTAGNASGINDGAAFLVLADAAAAARGTYSPMARLVAQAVAGVEARVMGDGPIPAVQLALKRAGLSLDQVRTEWVVYLDADDELEPGFLDWMADGTADLRAPAVRYVRGGNSVHAYVPKVWGHEHDCTGECLPYGNWLVIGSAVRPDTITCGSPAATSPSDVKTKAGPWRSADLIASCSAKSADDSA